MTMDGGAGKPVLGGRGDWLVTLVPSNRLEWGITVSLSLHCAKLYLETSFYTIFTNVLAFYNFFSCTRCIFMLLLHFRPWFGNNVCMKLIQTRPNPT